MNSSRIRLQPLFDMRKQEIVGYEALYSRENCACRFPSAVSILSSIVSELESSDYMGDSSYHLSDGDFRYFINMTDEDAVTSRFVKKFLETLEKSSLDPDKVVLEVSETTAISELECVRKNLGILCSNGVHIALDDFGTNFFTLDFISRLPLDIVKIDKVFVQEAPYSKQAADLLRVSIDVSHDIGCSVVAEGIEKPEHMDWAISVGADIGQGFMFTPSFFSKFGGSYLVSKNGVNNPFIPLEYFGKYVVSAVKVAQNTSKKSVA